ncbi:MAG: macro domain-containing protein [Planctomycetota bacterium]
MDVQGTQHPPAEPERRLIVTLVDLSPKMVAAWRQSFEQNPEVHIVQGSMLDQRVDAWVTPTNSKISMDGGLDAVIKNELGTGIEAAAKRMAKDRFVSRRDETLPLGCATCVPTGREVPRFLVSTPTMHQSSEDISATMNVALAAMAALQAVRMHNQENPTDPIYTVALPGLGVGTGQVPPEIAADLMWSAYSLMMGGEFVDFRHASAMLAEELGELNPMRDAPPVRPAPPAQKVAVPAPPPDEDFDDFD